MFDVLWTSNHFWQLGMKTPGGIFKPCFHNGLRKKTFFFVTAMGLKGTSDRITLENGIKRQGLFIGCAVLDFLVPLEDFVKI
jgi:hypothetical protein